MSTPDKPKPLGELLEPSRYSYRWEGEDKSAGYATSVAYEMARRLRLLDERVQSSEATVAGLGHAWRAGPRFLEELRRILDGK